ncbi:ABC transporter ATP-binding protein [Alicyclobacillus fodiniaquatilis]|uniref:ABC transporter ATP-binding protein n=1 Tax=Alicyclobacillus fodiniaquatilis TaxID=1661150 RepID=A0ABW4JQ14_9BACL
MADEPLLELVNVNKSFRMQHRMLHAVRDVNLTLERGQTLGLVGESGSGKSTLGRCILQLQRPDSGSVRFDGVELNRLAKAKLRQQRRRLQIIFQDPLAALHPKKTVGWNIEDPLRVHGIGTPRERRYRADQLIERMGLQPTDAEALPFELSGGQQQRVMIARALALEPKLVVCDEPVASLDVSVQAQIMQLLQELQVERELSYIFISHNLSAVEYVSHFVAVMYLGEIVEWAPAGAFYAKPAHPYTQALLQSLLHIPASKAMRHTLDTLPGEIPSPLDIPSGCAFHPRCPLAQDMCKTSKPVLQRVDSKHFASCHFAAATRG